MTRTLKRNEPCFDPFFPSEKSNLPLFAITEKERKKTRSNIESIRLWILRRKKIHLLPKRKEEEKKRGKTQEQQTRLFTSLNKIQDDISTRKFVCSRIATENIIISCLFTPLTI